MRIVERIRVKRPVFLTLNNISGTVTGETSRRSVCNYLGAQLTIDPTTFQPGAVTAGRLKHNYARFPE